MKVKIHGLFILFFWFGSIWITEISIAGEHLSKSDELITLKWFYLNHNKNYGTNWVDVIDVWMNSDGKALSVPKCEKGRKTQYPAVYSKCKRIAIYAHFSTCRSDRITVKIGAKKIWKNQGRIVCEE